MTEQQENSETDRDKRVKQIEIERDREAVQNADMHLKWK